MVVVRFIYPSHNVIGIFAPSFYSVREYSVFLVIEGMNILCVQRCDKYRNVWTALQSRVFRYRRCRRRIRRMICKECNLYVSAFRLRFFRVCVKCRLEFLIQVVHITNNRCRNRTVFSQYFAAYFTVTTIRSVFLRNGNNVLHRLRNNAFHHHL